MFVLDLDKSEVAVSAKRRGSFAPANARGSRDGRSFRRGAVTPRGDRNRRLVVKGLTLALLLTLAGFSLAGCIVDEGHGHWHHHDWR